jgi:AmmeMemoRadiSam system protein B
MLVCCAAAPLTCARPVRQMHLPYLVKRFEGHPFTLVPVIVGALTPESEQLYGRLLSSYLDEPANLFVFSSDFAHWGTRFNFLHHTPPLPVWQSIEALDREGMRLIEAGDAAAFTAYLRQHGNTICGRHPIGVFLCMLATAKTRFATRFTRYAQSSRALTVSDSSVSYATAVCVADVAAAEESAEA